MLSYRPNCSQSMAKSRYARCVVACRVVHRSLHQGPFEELLASHNLPAKLNDIDAFMRTTTATYVLSASFHSIYYVCLYLEIRTRHA